jgi:hypothetical protein
MRGFIVFLLVIGAAFWAGKTYLKNHGSGGLSIDSLISESPTKAAEARVQQILDNLEKGGDGNDIPLQTAICQWDSGLVVIQDRNELEQAYDAFEG